MLDTASSHADGIASLWWAMLIASGIVLVAVLVLLGIGLWRGHRDGRRPLDEVASRNLVIAGGVVVPVLVLATLVVGSVQVGAKVMSAPPADAISIEVVGRQWWWEVRYLDEDDQPIAVTANEIHVPVGRPVRFVLRSADVIHSFWVPNLQGKLDMIPGSVNINWFTADVAGVYRGQCAEFCGTQHALMAFEVVAVAPQKFEGWLAHQSRPAAPAAIQPDVGERGANGQAVFLQSGCGTCHAVRGTTARGDLGPDLTHVASRRKLAAATMPNTRGHMGGWISDPQHNKPGALMPATRLSPADHRTLVGWLEGLE